MTYRQAQEFLKMLTPDERQLIYDLLDALRCVERKDDSDGQIRGNGK